MQLTARGSPVISAALGSRATPHPSQGLRRVRGDDARRKRPPSSLRASAGVSPRSGCVAGGGCGRSQGTGRRGGFGAGRHGEAMGNTLRGTREGAEIPGAGDEPLFSPATLIHHYLGIFRILAKSKVGRGGCEHAFPIPLPSFLLPVCN